MQCWCGGQYICFDTYTRLGPGPLSSLGARTRPLLQLLIVSPVVSYSVVRSVQETAKASGYPMAKAPGRMSSAYNVAPIGLRLHLCVSLAL